MTKSYRSPQKITAKHVRAAAKIWDMNSGFKTFRKSLIYDVVINGRRYPPKAIASIANGQATGRALSPKDLAGAKDGTWHRRLKKLGFEIVGKSSDTAFKSEVAASLKLSRSERLDRIAKSGNGTPQRISVSVTRFSRNPHVVAERLSLAKGNCEHCKKPAPFRRVIDHMPFLEVHHKRPLSKGGLDTVENTEALCPNCHSKIHDRLRMDREVE